MRVAVFNDTRPDKGHYGCALVMDRIDDLVRNLGGTIVFLWPLDLDWRDNLDLLPKEGDVDLLIVNGEGSIHGAPKNKRAVSLSSLGKLAKHYFKVPSVLLNATICDNDVELYDELKFFDIVWVRDLKSVEICGENGVFARYCPDLTLTTPLPESFTVERSGVGVTDSVDRVSDFELRRVSQRLSADFLPMVSDAPSSFSEFRKFRFGKIKAWMRAVWLNFKFDSLQRPKSVSEFLDWLRSKELIVTGRYHTVTMCLLTETPFLFLSSNTFKTEALCADSGLNIGRKIEDLTRFNWDKSVGSFRFSEAELLNLRRFRGDCLERFVQMRKSISDLCVPFFSDEVKAEEVEGRVE